VWLRNLMWGCMAVNNLDYNSNRKEFNVAVKQRRGTRYIDVKVRWKGGKHKQKADGKSQ